MNLHDFSFSGLEGENYDKADFVGRAVLVVNTASQCGFTPQYADMQQLWSRYRENGLVILGLPSNDFGGQEPGDDAQIGAFCSDHYAVDFPMGAKVGVLENPHPIYQAIQDELGDAALPKWNFHKYLFGANGELVEMWGSKVNPLSDEVVAAIRAQLPG